MAINNRNKDLIHHSDSGLQYCSKDYMALANSAEIKMSMTEQSDPYENALAEKMKANIDLLNIKSLQEEIRTVEEMQKQKFILVRLRIKQNLLIQLFSDA
jgi:transposase InsO family protein